MMLFSLLAGVVSAESPRDGEPFDWSEQTCVIWPLKNDAPDLQTVISLGDWFRLHAMSGRPGVRFVLNNIALSGIRTVWFRSVGGGWATYPSDVRDVTIRRAADTAMNCQVIDQPKEAVAFAHKLGMKIYAWFPPLEEAHAWPGNSRSRYVDLHRDQWDKTIEGYPSGMPSFFFKQYRDYKLAIARELLTKYDFDGLVLDFERQGAPYRSDKCGYLPRIMDAFQAETGKDPRALRQDDPDWRRFRASHVGKFVQSVRKMIDSLDRPVPLMMMYPPDDPLTAHWDVMEWDRKGYFDSYAFATHGPSNEGWESPTDQADRWILEAKKLRRPVTLIYYSAGPKIENLRHRIRQGLQAGFTSIALFESTHLFWNRRFCVPLSLAAPYGAMIRSPELDFPGGGRIVVSSAGKWRLTLDAPDGKILAQGKPHRRDVVELPPMKGKHALVFTCEISRNASTAGLAAEGWAVDSQGGRRAIHTDASWTAKGKNVTLTTIGQPGIPPFGMETQVDQGGEK
ncbi:MAG: family 10 glycosylhydrolase [Phycisphaerae bacterium]|nr:family 10 glycosylhydrolase [Phycisphaerae bacterium]